MVGQGYGIFDEGISLLYKICQIVAIILFCFLIAACGKVEETDSEGEVDQKEKEYGVFYKNLEEVLKAGLLEGLNLPDEPKAISMQEYDVEYAIPYNIPLEEIAEKIEYLYAYEKMLCETSASTQYEELEPLPEGRMRMTIYTAEGNKVLFLPEGIANTEVLINDEVCELYYSEEREGYLFYYINDFCENEDGVPVNAVGNGGWEEWFAICIIDGESQPTSDSRYYTYYTRFDLDDLNKIGEIEVNLDAEKRISLSNINVHENEYIESMIRTVQSTLAEKEKYGEYKMYLGTYGRMAYDVNRTVFKASGCVVGKDLEQYFFFTIYDASPSGAIISYASSYYPPSEQEWESGKYYFSGGGWLPCANQEERIQKIKEMNRVEIPFTVTEGEVYHAYTNTLSDEKEHEVAEKIDFDAMSAEEAIDTISYLYNYSEWFGMNELGCPVGEVRGFEGKELIMYTRNYGRESLYFIPAEMVNEIVICEDGREYPMYINEDGYAEFYSISGNPAAIKTEQLKTTLWSKVEMGKASFENLSMVGRKTLEKHELSLLEVPKVESDEYVDALVDYIRDLLVQEEKYGEYKIFIGEYEAMDANRVCLSAAVCGEEEYYVRYLNIKTQKEKYYFWPVGFGLNGSLEECEADRHYMNKVCIDRTKQLRRIEIVLDITQERKEETVHTYEGYFYLHTYTDIWQDVDLHITNLESFSNGTLYALELEQPEFSDPFDKLLSRKYIGYFYVTDEVIYYLAANEHGYTDENNSVIISQIKSDEEKFLKQCIIVCCEDGTENITDENGYHAYVQADGERRIFRYYNDYLYGSKDYMLMVWEKGNGLTYYMHGNGAKNMHVEFGNNIKEEHKIDYGYPYKSFNES